MSEKIIICHICGIARDKPGALHCSAAHGFGYSGRWQTNFLAEIQGGIGPDVWDREFQIIAVDFRDACNQAIARAEELGGQVVLLQQSE